MDVSCIPSIEGYCTHEQRPANQPSEDQGLYWEIIDIVPHVTGQNKAFRLVDTNSTDKLQWLGAGSRPNHHRGPCQSFAHENFRPDHNALTITMRIQVEAFNPNGGSNVRRFYNCEFETIVPKPILEQYNETTYQFRFEAASVNNISGNLWLWDYRTHDKFCLLKPAGGQAKWIKLWAVMKLPDPLGVKNTCVYDLWIDQEDGNGWVKYDWQRRDKGGWTDVELTSFGDVQHGIIQFDYICYTYEALDPGSLAIPAEKDPAVPIQPVPDFDQNNLGHIRQQPDGYAVEITTDKIVTGIVTNPDNNLKFYYISEPDGSEGIRVDLMTGKSVVRSNGNPVTLSVGNKVQLKGGLRTSASEKTIQAHYIERTASTTSRPSPVELNDYKIKQSFRTQLNQFVPRQTQSVIESGVITEIQNGVKRPWLVDLSWSNILHSRIKVAGKNWLPDQWRGATLKIPAQGTHSDLYYTVLANEADTIILTRPVFWTSINVSDDGVLAGETCMFVSDEYEGDRYDGRYIQICGHVASVDGNGNFYLENGARVHRFETIQDIMIPYNSAMDQYPYTLWQQPEGIRCSIQNGMSVPNPGEYVSVQGCLGAYHYRKYVTVDFPLGRTVDEIKQSVVMPVIWTEQWQPEVAADLNHQEPIDILDLRVMASNWLHASSDFSDPADIPDDYLAGDISGSDGLPDGVVNLLDYCEFTGCYLQNLSE